MTKRNTFLARRTRFEEIKVASAVITFPAQGLNERRDVAARNALLQRVRSEFLEMPALSLTLAQASRLFGIRSEVCSRIFAQLTKEGLLKPLSDGRYARCVGRV